MLPLSSECSAVVVAPAHALTAAHCVEEGAPLALGSGAREIPVVACAVHPRAYGEPRPCGAGPGAAVAAHDLALLTLAEAVGVTPLDVLLADPGLSPDFWRGRAVRLVGWDRRPALVGPLARRTGVNRVVVAAHGLLLTEPASAGGFATVIGDSGGPLLVRLGAEERVAGILRGGPAPASRRSLYAATYAPENARWLAGALPPERVEDLALDEGRPFGAAR